MKKKENRLVVGDTSWADTIPKWLLDEIKAERMIYGLGSVMNPDCPKIGDAEVIAYLMTASFRAPLGYEYTEIYVYLTAKMMKKKGKQLEDFMEEKLKKGLIGDEERLLKELRSMIYSKRGGEIQHPLLNFLREFKKDCDREEKKIEKTKQIKLLF